MSTWRTAFLVFSLLLSTFALPPFLGFDSPLGPAEAVVNQGNATGCRAYGTNWTWCQNAFASDDLYANANGSIVVPSVIQRVATTTDSADASSWSFSHAVPAGSNRTLLLAIATDNGEAVSGTPQYGSTSFGLLRTLVHSTGSPRVTLYLLIAPAVGTALVTGTLAATDRYTAGAISYTGVHQTSPGNGVTTAEGNTGTTMSVTVPSEVGDLVLDATANLGGSVPSVGGGQTQIYNEEMGGFGQSNHRATTSEEAGANSVAMSWTGKQDGAEWVSIGFNLNRAGVKQYARPDTDLVVTNWFDSAGDGVNYTKMDESVPDDDATYTQTVTNPSDLDDAVFGLSNVVDPQRSDGHILRYRFRNVGSNGGSAVMSLTVELEQGTTVLASWSHLSITSLTYATFAQTLTAGQAGSITDYADLRVKLDVTFLSGGGNRQLRLTWLEFEVPSPSPSFDTVWRVFGFTLDSVDQVQQVEVGVEWWRNNTSPELQVTVSWDGGTTWATNQTATNKSVDDNTVEWLDFTSATTWDASSLSDSNLRARVGTNASGARLDYVTVRTTYNDAPEVSNLRLEDVGGQSLAGSLLDPAVAYRFLFNVTDEDGWGDIGGDGAVGLRMWYDGNVTPELTFAEQTNGSDYRIELRYEDITDPGNVSLDEWSVTVGSAIYDAFASVLTQIYNGPTLIGYEFNLSVALGLSVKAASAPTNATPGAYNDPGSWNVEAVAFDGSVGDTQRRAAGGEHMEFGVFARALMAYSASASPSTLQPGDSAVLWVDFENSGQGVASRVWVNVSLPLELTYVGDDAGLIGGVRSGSFTFTFTSVAPGSYAFNLTASAAGGVADGTIAVTNFTFQAVNSIGIPLNSSAQDVAVTIVNGVLAYSVAASPSTLAPGQSTVFHIDFTNSGQGSAASIWVNVTLPPELAYVGDDAALIGGVRSGSFTFTFANIAPGSYAFNLTASAAGGVADGTVAVTNFTFQAVDSLGFPLNQSTQNVGVTIVSGEVNVVLEYSVTPSLATLEPGQSMVFHIDFTNSGNSSAGALWVNVSLPPELAYASDDAASIGGVRSGSFTFTFTNVAPGSYAFNFTASVAGGVADGTVAVTAFFFEAVDSLGVPLPQVIRNVAVTISQTVISLGLVSSASILTPGDLIVLNGTATNFGSASATNVLIEATVDANVTYLSSSPTGAHDPIARKVGWSLGALGPGAQVSVEWTVQVMSGTPDGSRVMSRVGVQYQNSTGAPLPGREAVTVAWVQVPSFAPWLLLDRSTAEHGDEVSALFHHNNTGSTAALRAWANWSLGGHYELLFLSPALPYTASADGFSITLANLAPGFHSLTARFRVLSGLRDGLDMGIRIDWVATDSRGNPLPIMTLLRGVELRAPSIALTLQSATEQVEVGSVFTIELTLRNHGRVSAIGWLNLTLPSGVAYVSDNGTSAAAVAKDRVLWTLNSLPSDFSTVLGITFSGTGELGVKAFRFDLNFTDLKGSAPKGVFSNALTLEVVPGGSGETAWPWSWVWLAILSVAFAGAAYFFTRRRSKDIEVDDAFVVDNSGLILAHRSNTVLPYEDEDLVAASFTAVREFVRHTFSQGRDEEVRAIEFGEREILIEPGQHHYVAIVHGGQNRGELSRRMRVVSEKIDHRFGDLLAEQRNLELDTVRDLTLHLAQVWKRPETLRDLK